MKTPPLPILSQSASCRCCLTVLLSVLLALANLGWAESNSTQGISGTQLAQVKKAEGKTPAKAVQAPAANATPAPAAPAAAAPASAAKAALAKTPSRAAYKPQTLPANVKALLPKTPAELQSKMPKIAKVNVSQLKTQLSAAAAAVSASSAPAPTPASMAGKKVLIVFQENTGHLSSLPDNTPQEIVDMIAVVVDAMAENFEDMKSTLQSNGRYDQVVLLTDTNCTAAKLRSNLIDFTKRGATIDLVILGHGNTDCLGIHSGKWLLGSETYDPAATDPCCTHIRSLLTDAQAQGCSSLNLRLVYMCNCHGSTTNDDWTAIGAKACVGARGLNYMPEPVTTFFMQYWLDGRSASEAARKSCDDAKPLFSLIFPPNAVTQYMTVTETVWCGEEWVNDGCECTNWVTGKKYKCGCLKAKYCDVSVTVPSGVNLTPNENIVSSELLTAGDGNIRFDWTY